MPHVAYEYGMLLRSWCVQLVGKDKDEYRGFSSNMRKDFHTVESVKNKMIVIARAFWNLQKSTSWLAASGGIFLELLHAHSYSDIYAVFIGLA